MSITDQLASSMGKRDELPNIALAKKIAVSRDKVAMQELIDNLHHRDKDIQHDSIKVIYEVGALQPSLLKVHIKELVALLDSKNNRLQWGAMTALAAVTEENPSIISANLDKIIEAAEKGSVITHDQCVEILIKLCIVKTYAAKAFTLLIDRLLVCPTNQLPMYAEKALPVITKDNKSVFVNAVAGRLEDIEKESKRRRVEAVIRKANKLY